MRLRTANSVEIKCLGTITRNFVYEGNHAKDIVFVCEGAEMVLLSLFDLVAHMN